MKSIPLPPQVSGVTSVVLHPALAHSSTALAVDLAIGAPSNAGLQLQWGQLSSTAATRPPLPLLSIVSPRSPPSGGSCPKHGQLSPTEGGARLSTARGGGDASQQSRRAAPIAIASQRCSARRWRGRSSVAFNALVNGEAHASQCPLQGAQDNIPAPCGRAYTRMSEKDERGLSALSCVRRGEAVVVAFEVNLVVFPMSFMRVQRLKKRMLNVQYLLNTTYNVGRGIRASAPISTLLVSGLLSFSAVSPRPESRHTLIPGPHLPRLVGFVDSLQTLLSDAGHLGACAPVEGMCAAGAHGSRGTRGVWIQEKKVEKRTSPKTAAALILPANMHTRRTSA
ncbi:hypothetical protein C8R46DRAFT_1186915 [Mycena filopes]|nr:hypothetical protein C8R46DRAFT_1186915 [Mycena filopes]